MAATRTTRSRTSTGRAVIRLAALAAAVLLVAGTVVTVLPGVAAANGCSAAGAYAAGSGDGSSPAQALRIATKEQLLRLAGTSGDWGKHFLQTADIDLTGCTWTPVGPFTGVYDGGGRRILGLDVQGAGVDVQGLFGRVEGSSASISDLVLVAPEVSGKSNVGAAVGTLLNGASLTDVRVEGGTVTGTGGQVGGLVGEAGWSGLPAPTPTLIADSESSATVVGGSASLVGGLLGYGYRGLELRDVAATGTVSGDDGVGGLVGALDTTEAAITVLRGTASGDVTATSFGAGGLVGQVDNREAGITVSLAEVSASGDVTSSSTATGGLIGYASVSGAAGVLRITDATATGAVVGTSDVGGLIGEGGKNGNTAEFEVVRVRSSGSVGVTGTGRTGIGGAMGRLSGGLLSQVSASGDVDAGDGSRVGGLVGSIGADAFGFQFSAELHDVHAAGAVSGGDHVGGLVGFVVHDSTVTRALARGAVTSAAAAGGLVATLDAGKTLTQSGNVWDVETTTRSGSVGDATADDVLGLPTVDLKLLATYSARGWGIVDGWASPDTGVKPPSVWGICARANDGYASLRWTGTSPSDNDCVEPSVAVATVSRLAVDCTPDPATSGATITCTVSGADPDIEFSWSAGPGASPATGAVRVDAAGRGTFRFTLGTVAPGTSVVVALGGWGVSTTVTVGGGPVPRSIPAGGGDPSAVAGRTATLAVATLLAGLLVLPVLGRGRRIVVPRPS